MKLWKIIDTHDNVTFSTAKNANVLADFMRRRFGADYVGIDYREIRLSYGTKFFGHYVFSNGEETYRVQPARHARSVDNGTAEEGRR